MNLTRPLTTPAAGGFTMTLTFEAVLLAPRLSRTTSENVSVAAAATEGAAKVGCATVLLDSVTGECRRSGSRHSRRPMPSVSVPRTIERDGAAGRDGLVSAGIGGRRIVGRRVRTTATSPPPQAVSKRAEVAHQDRGEHPFAHTALYACAALRRAGCVSPSRVKGRTTPELCGPSRETLPNVASVSRTPVRLCDGEVRGFSP